MKMRISILFAAVAAVSFSCSLPAQPVLQWDADQDFSNGTDGGGIKAAWTTTAARWYDGVGNVAWTDGAIALFGGNTNGNPNLSGNPFNPAPYAIVFTNFAGYEISAAAAPRLIVQSGNIYVYADASISAIITNAPADITTGIRKLGPAKLSFTGPNQVFIGGLYVLEGTLALNKKQQIGGASQSLTVNGGTVELTLVENISDRMLYVGDNGATIDLPAETDSWLWQQPRGTNGTLTKKGLGVLVLGNNNGGGGLTNATGRTGATIIEAGTLMCNTSVGSSLGTGPVTVNAGATLAGPGLIGGPVTVLGVLSPASGNAPALPNMTLANGLDMSGGGTNKWELAALKDDSDGIAGTDFDRLSITNGNLVLGGSSKLSINFTGAATDPDSGDPFWQNNHTWTVVNLSDTASNPSSGSFASLDNASYAAGTFSTSVSGNGSILLTFTSAAAPPPAPHIDTIVNEGRTNVIISWTSVADYQYEVQYNTNLATTNWYALTNLTASGSLTSIADPAAAEAARHYRVALQLP